MFSTLNSNFEVQDLFEKPLHLVEIPTIDEKNVVGTRKRSRTGCLCCRELKKRCDEVHPTCGKCNRRGVKCIWPSKIFVRRNDKKIQKNIGESSLNKSNISKLDIVDKKQSNGNNEDKKLVFDGYNNLELKSILLPSDSSPDIKNIDLQLEDIKNTNNIEETNLSLLKTVPDFTQLYGIPFSPTPDVLDPESPFTQQLLAITGIDPNVLKAVKESFLNDLWQQHHVPLPHDHLTGTYSLMLDEQSLGYLQYFHQNVVKHLSITPEGSKNYFVHTFFTASQNEEAITRALAAWGAFFQKGDSGKENIDKLITQSQDIIEANYFKEGKKLDAHDRYILVCYYLVMIGIEVCRGDVQRWWEFFSKCCSLMNDIGGITNFCEENGFLNGVKWLILNMEFHDMLLSATQQRGTIIPMDEYRTLFSNYGVLENGGYGLDAFQGACQPIIFVLGEIMTSHVELKKQRLDLEKRLRECNSQEEYKELRHQRIRFYLYADKIEKEFLQKVSECQPPEAQITLLNDDDEDHLENHAMLFEAYRETCNLYILLYLKHHLPRSVDVQLTLLHALSFIERLSETPIVPALTMPILVCGILCYQECDRNQLILILEQLKEKYIPRNLHRVGELLKEMWKRNPEGNISIDWADVCAEKGWTLCTC